MGNLLVGKTDTAINYTDINNDIYDYRIDNEKILHKIKATDEQIQELKTNVKNLDQLINIYKKAIIGGSRGLKIWTGREFNVDDNDIFLHSIEGNRYTGKLEKDVEQLMKIYPDCSIRVQLSTDPKKAVLNEDETVEEFDKAIIGTINLKYESNKYQFVMIEKNPEFKYSLDLVEWYARTSDLPVFILYDKFNPFPHFIVKHGHGHWLAKQGILSGLKHEYRIEKYEKKGFKSIVELYNVFSEKTLYNSTIDVNKYNSEIEE